MDEPTAALGVAETAKVEELIRRLKERGSAILIVSHNMEQVFRLADRVAVLRRGTHVATKLLSETSHNELVAMITGLAE
jgi:simple sugar transport system ATP-binding protein